MIVLTTERLVLRHLRESDAGFIRELLTDRSWIDNIGDKRITSLEDARAYIRNGPRRMYHETGFGLLAVERARDREVLGVCGLIRRPGLDDVDIGFAFLPRHWGRGYARESAEATLGYARELGLLRVVAITLPSNAPSIRLLEAMGLRYSRAVRLPDDPTELSLYEIDLAQGA